MCNNEPQEVVPFQFKLMMGETAGQAGQTQQAPPGLLPLDHYRLQLYNYAVHAERLRTQQFLPVFSPYPPHPRLLSMSLLNHRLLPPEEPKPQHSYIGLIAMAILSSPDLKLVLSDIYQYILDHYPYFRSRGPGWRNSIRHNLSLNDCFVKAGRSANGKGHYWAIHPANVEDFKKGDFRRRKAQRKVRKHMGLAVDDDGNDSPSPPPMTMTPPPTTLWPPVSPLVFPVPPSVTRKRQFDVASLLAPDEDPLSKRLTITPYSSDEEDIDVVSSDKTPVTPQATQTSWFRPPVFAEHQQLVARYYEQLAAHSRRVQTPLVSGSPPLDHEPST